MPDIDVRPAVAADIPAIQSIARASWSVVYSDLLPRKLQDAALVSWYSEPALTRAVCGGSIFLVAERNGSVAGFAQFVTGEEKSSAELRRLYVRPSEQRNGVGAELIRRGLATLSAAGVDSLIARVGEGDPGLRRFYEKCGFVFDEQTPDGMFGQPAAVAVYENIRA